MRSPRRAPLLAAILALAVLQAAPAAAAPPGASGADATTAATGPSPPRPPGTAAAPTTPLTPRDAELLAAWYAAVGPTRPGETFGALTARVAQVQLGKPYHDPPAPAGPETLVIRLEDFECLSFVETSLGVARCVARGTPDAGCFAREVTALRYRGGTILGFASKMHYFDEWLADNARRGNVRELTAELGGAPWPTRFDFVTRHRARYAPLAEPAALAAMLEVEDRLSARQPWVVGRERLAAVVPALATGDVIGFVGAKPGLLVTHVGLVVRGGDRVPRLLHASSHHGRVVLTSASLEDYVMRRPERRGLVVARPLGP